MEIKDARQVIKETINWFPEDSPGRLILKSFELDEYNEEAFAVPIPFEKFTALDEWKLAKDNSGVTSRIRYIRESMDTREFPFRSLVYLTHEKGYCYLILGTEHVRVAREKKEQGGLPGVTLSFSEKGDGESLPVFGKGKPVELYASSPFKGWLYLFSVDADRVITPVYPGEGLVSDIELPQNTRVNVSDKVNAELKRNALHKNHKYTPLCYNGNAEGLERLIVMMLETPVPVTVAHLRSRFPLPTLFAHEIIHRGVGYGSFDTNNDFNSLPLSQIAIGTLDYYYEG